MKTTQANDVNKLLYWVLDAVRPTLGGGVVVTGTEAMLAAARLATAASKQLNAGLHGLEVCHLWHDEPPFGTAEGGSPS